MKAMSKVWLFSNPMAAAGTGAAVKSTVFRITRVRKSDSALYTEEIFLKFDEMNR